jgi:hypothetical protein
MMGVGRNISALLVCRLVSQRRTIGGGINSMVGDANVEECSSGKRTAYRGSSSGRDGDGIDDHGRKFDPANARRGEAEAEKQGDDCDDDAVAGVDAAVSPHSAVDICFGVLCWSWQGSMSSHIISFETSNLSCSIVLAYGSILPLRGNDAKRPSIMMETACNRNQLPNVRKLVNTNNETLPESNQLPAADRISFSTQAVVDTRGGL